MYFLFVTAFIKVAHFTLLNDSAPNPAAIANPETEETDVGPELDSESPAYFNEWNRHSSIVNQKINEKQAFEATLILLSKLQGDVTRAIEIEQSVESTEEFSNILGNLVKYGGDLKKRIRKADNQIAIEKEKNNIQLLKIFQHLELNKTRLSALPNTTKRLAFKIQEFLLFMVENVVSDNDVVINIEVGLARPEETSNKFIRSFLKSEDDIALLLQVQEALENLIFNTNEIEKTLAIVQTKLNSLFRRISVEVLTPVLLDEKSFVEDIIKSDNRTLTDCEEEFVERYNLIDSKQLVLVIPLKFISKDKNVEQVAIRVPILSKKNSSEPKPKQQEVNSS